MQTPVSHPTFPKEMAATQTPEHEGIPSYGQSQELVACVSSFSPGDAECAGPVPAWELYNYHLASEPSQLTSGVRNLIDYGNSTLNFNSYRNANQSNPGPLVPARKLPITRQPIHQAAQKGHIKIVKLLLKAGPRCADLQDKDGVTPLLLAAEYGHTDVVEALLAAGANPNTPGRKSRRTCMHQAARGGHAECVRVILAHGATADEADSQGRTALILASAKGCAETVKELLRAGANPHACSQIGQKRAIHLAAQGGYLECVRLLLSVDVTVDEPDSNGLTPIMLACAGGFLDVVKLILSERLKTTGVNAGGCPSRSRPWQPLHVAAYWGHLLTIQFLIEAGAFVDQPAEGGATALTLACSRGHLRVAEWLVKKGADINHALPVSRRRPIHHAAENGHLELVQFLHCQGADFDSGEVKGVSPLWLASRKGHTHIVGFLREHNVSPTARTIDTSNCPLHQAAHEGHTDVVTALIRHKADVNAVEKDGWSPLMLAARQGHHEIVQLLVGNGAEINLKDQKGATALWFAAQQGHCGVAIMLLDRLATPNVYSQGRLPIHQAAQNGHLKMVQLLVDCGSNVDSQTLGYGGLDPGITPLWLASQTGHDAVVEFLLEKGASPVIGF